MKFEKVIKEHFNGNMVSKVTKKVLKEDCNKFLTEGANAELYKNAMAAYKNDDDNFFYDLSDDELVTLWVSCAITKDNPYGAAYDDEVYDAISERENSRELFDRAANIIMGGSKSIEEEVELTNCPNCDGKRFNDSIGLCVDCGYDEKGHGDLDESINEETDSSYGIIRYVVRDDNNQVVGATTLDATGDHDEDMYQFYRWLRRSGALSKYESSSRKGLWGYTVESRPESQYDTDRYEWASLEQFVDYYDMENDSNGKKYFYVGWWKTDIDEFAEYIQDKPEISIFKHDDGKYYMDTSSGKYGHQIDDDVIDTLKNDNRFKDRFVESESIREEWDDTDNYDFETEYNRALEEVSDQLDNYGEEEAAEYLYMNNHIYYGYKDKIAKELGIESEYRKWTTPESKSINESIQSYDIMLEDDDCIIDSRTGTLKVSLQVLDDFVKDSVIRIKFVEEPDVTYEYKMISVDDEYITMEQLDRVKDELDSDLYKEGYELLSGTKVEVYSDYYVAKDRAKSLGLIEAEYGNTYSDDYAYSYWNESGDRNDDEQVIAYYRFKNGTPRPLTVEEREYVLNKYELGSFDNEAMEESVDLKESAGGRFELSIWVPGSGGDDDRERTLLRSDNMQEIIDTAYDTDLDDDEAFYLSDWKGIYSTDLDQCYDAEELEDQIYNVWFYSPEADMRRTLGKILLPQNESEEPAQDKKPLNEGPGAGYTVEGVITNVNIHNVNECKFQRSDSYGNYYEVSLVASAMFEDVEAHSYYYGGEVGDMPIHISHCVICMDGEPTDEDIYDALSGAKIKVIIGGGWSHTTFDGRINASVDNREIDTYYDVLDSVIFDISEVNYVYEIDDLVTGAFERDEEDMDESINESYQEVAYINDGYTNFRVVGGGFNTRDALVSVEDADGRPSRLSTGDVFEFYTWYDAKGNVIREPEDMDESLNEDLESRLVNIFGNVAPEDDYDGYYINNSPICVNTNAIDNDGNPTSGLLFYTNGDYLIPSVADGELDIQAPDFIYIDGVAYGDMLQFTRKLSDEELKKIVDELISKAKKYVDEDDDSSNVMW